jgi:hypothetical protein
VVVGWCREELALLTLLLLARGIALLAILLRIGLSRLALALTLTLALALVRIASLILLLTHAVHLLSLATIMPRFRAAAVAGRVPFAADVNGAGRDSYVCGPDLTF